jgi:hypothetical protein
MIVETVNGPRWFTTRTRLREILDLADNAHHKRAVELLIEERFLFRHKRNNTATGFILSEGWSAEHELHLRSRARTLLREARVEIHGNGRAKFDVWLA